MGYISDPSTKVDDAVSYGYVACGPPCIIKL